MTQDRTPSGHKVSRLDVEPYRPQRMVIAAGQFFERKDPKAEAGHRAAVVVSARDWLIEVQRTLCEQIEANERFNLDKSTVSEISHASIEGSLAIAQALDFDLVSAYRLWIKANADNHLRAQIGRSRGSELLLTQDRITWSTLQKVHLAHEKEFDRNVYGSTPIDRLKVVALRLGKLTGQVAQAAAADVIRPQGVQRWSARLLHNGLSVATALDESLSDTVIPRIGVVARRGPEL